MVDGVLGVVGLDAERPEPLTGLELKVEVACSLGLPACIDVACLGSYVVSEVDLSYC